MRYRLYLLIALLSTPYLCAADYILEVRGLSGELEDNVEAVMSTVNISSSLDEQRVRRQFREAIRKGLRAKGYYEPEIRFRNVRDFMGRAVMVADVTAGQPILIEEINVNITGQALTDPDYLSLMRTVPVKGEVLDHGDYDRFKSTLTGLALRKGYFDALLTRNQLAVAPGLHQGFWFIDYNSGDRYRFGQITFTGSQIDEEYLYNLAPFKDGEYYTSEQLAEFSRRLSATNWFNSVVVSPGFENVYGDKQIPMDAIVSPRNKNRIELGGGYATDIGPRLKANWVKPWVNSKGHSTETSLTLSDPEQTVDFSYKIPLKKDALNHYYLLQAGIKREDQNDTESNSATVNVARFWNSTTGWQRSLNLRWSEDHFTQADETHTTTLLYPGVNLSRTRQRGGTMPYWGDTQAFSVDVSDRTWGSDVDFVVFQAQSVWIRTLADKHRFVARGNFGWIETNDFNKVPPSLRFFAGGDRSVRGYKYKSISPVDSQDKLTGASKLATGSIEYQYNVTGKWWGAAFFDMGEAVNDFDKTDWKKGAGIGVRWQSPVGPIKLDIAKPIGDSDKNGTQFYIGLGPEL